jgi:hypothetical protein
MLERGLKYFDEAGWYSSNVYDLYFGGTQFQCQVEDYPEVY